MFPTSWVFWFCWYVKQKRSLKNQGVLIGSEHNQNPNSTKNLFVFEINKFKIRCKCRLHKSKKRNQCWIQFKHKNKTWKSSGLCLFDNTNRPTTNRQTLVCAILKMLVVWANIKHATISDIFLTQKFAGTWRCQRTY